MKLPAFATLFCLILLPLSATTATAPQKHALDGSVAALEAGPQNADEELALSFVMEFGLGEDFANMLGFAGIQNTRMQALVEQHGTDTVFAIQGKYVAEAVAAYDPLWRLLIARGLLTAFTAEELQSYLDEEEDSPYAEKMQAVDLSGVVAGPQGELLMEISAGVVDKVEAELAGE